jgi:Prp8 binding protein
VDAGALKKAKRDTGSSALVTFATTSQALTISYKSTEPGRTSSLMAPEVSLLGHEGAVYSIAFDPSGQHLCSGSFDKQICKCNQVLATMFRFLTYFHLHFDLVLWDINGKCKNYNVLSGHKSAVLQVCWPTQYSIVSCSADKTVATWDANKGIRTRKFLEHTAVVNSCAVATDAPHLIASGSDDCTVILWDARAKQSVASIYHDYQVCAVCLSSDGQSVYTGGIDNTIRRFDLRSGARSGWDAAKLQDLDQPDMVLEGHTDTVTGLALSPDGCSLLSNAMDSQLRLWNVRPFSAGQADSGDSRVSSASAHSGVPDVTLSSV